MPEILRRSYKGTIHVKLSAEIFRHTSRGIDGRVRGNSLPINDARDSSFARRAGRRERVFPRGTVRRHSDAPGRCAQFTMGELNYREVVEQAGARFVALRGNSVFFTDPQTGASLS